MNPFVAIDVETANPYCRGSICQIALVEHANNTQRVLYSSLVNPEIDFSPCNIRIHGITQDMVSGMPTIRDMLNEIAPILRGNTLVAHNASFDICALEQPWMMLILSRSRWFTDAP
jgi:DNA polymerase-3 subunit epsilon